MWTILWEGLIGCTLLVSQTSVCYDNMCITKSHQLSKATSLYFTIYFLNSKNLILIYLQILFFFFFNHHNPKRCSKLLTFVSFLFLIFYVYFYFLFFIVKGNIILSLKVSGYFWNRLQNFNCQFTILYILKFNQCTRFVSLIIWYSVKWWHGKKMIRILD